MSVHADRQVRLKPDTTDSPVISGAPEYGDEEILAQRQRQSKRPRELCRSRVVRVVPRLEQRETQLPRTSLELRRRREVPDVLVDLWFAGQTILDALISAADADPVRHRQDDRAAWFDEAHKQREAAVEIGSSVPWLGFPVGYAISGVLLTIFGYVAMLLAQ